jgi:hypothetical protein
MRKAFVCAVKDFDEIMGHSTAYFSDSINIMYNVTRRATSTHLAIYYAIVTKVNVTNILSRE